MSSCAENESGIQNNETFSAGVESLVAAESVIADAFVPRENRAAAETILLVEDEAFVRKAAAEVLESAGYKVVLACCAVEALETSTSSGSIDLLLTDIVLPEKMNGSELAAKFGSLCPRARVLLMTGYPEQLGLCGRSAHSTLYLAKPFSSRMLLKTVREALDTNVRVLQVQS